ncbi:MAG TPA: hypothetical protein VFB14_12290 [Bryobacteraceae bacterium]|jgi:hypothetical protein|nr:hypothetical protein [Bryobacteraceae bacterium]
MLVSPDIAAADPLEASMPLKLRHVLFPYGFPLHIKSTDPEVIRAAELSWGSFEQRFREPPLEIRFIISEETERRRLRPPRFRAQSNLLAIVAGFDNFACCDLSRGFGFACLTKAALANQDYFRYHFLEAMVCTLLDTQHLVALHAACIEMNGRGVMFVGESGAGKSSLAYACARRGHVYISDEASLLVRRRAERLVLGNPQVVRFRPAARALFPELKGHVRSRNGKLSIEIATRDLRHVQTAPGCNAEYVLFLNRSDAPGLGASLTPMSQSVALRLLFRQVWPGELPIHEERLKSVEQLLSARLYQFTYSDLDRAVDFLEQATRAS